MKQTLKNVFHSPKFVVGFIIFVAVLLFSIIYPLISRFGPLDNVVQKDGGFAEPGTYVNVADVIEADLDGSSVKFDVDTVSNRIEARLDDEEKEMMLDFCKNIASTSEKYSAEDDETIAALTIDDITDIVTIWQKYYDASLITGTKAVRNKYKAVDNKLATMLSEEAIIIAEEADGELTKSGSVDMKSFVNTSDIASRYTLVLGSDNFGRDMITELSSSILVSIRIGFIAGIIASLIGVTLGLLAGFIGGFLDNFITFLTNLFTVIPGFVLLILIANAIGGSARGTTLIAVIIGLTGWPWTARSVRSQVLSLRNRDHVNMSKISGHSLPKILIQDILPFVSSYVVMAFILQISSGILSEAQLSMLGLGPATTKTTTLGLMMNWAQTFSAPTKGFWWAFVPTILSIAFITFSLNLMNTGLDQVFNPQLRD